MSTSERQVLVVGACGGIGRVIALQQAASGARLLLVDLDTSALEQVRAECRAAGASEVTVLGGDVTVPEVAARMAAVVDDGEGLDGLVYSAGIAGPVAPLGEYPAESFERVMRVNLYGAFHVISSALPALRAAREASVVVVGSTSSIRGRSLLAGYVASKHAVLGLVRTASLELADTHVRVNAVLPGPVATLMLDGLNEAAARYTSSPDAAFGRGSAPSRTASPEDVANTISFLLSSASRHVRGAAWVVDGGGSVG